MMIEKILNNNVVVSNDNAQHEIIIMGRGIAYKKKCGDEVDDRMVDKIFTLNNKDNAHRLQELLSEIPLEHMEVSDTIIDYAKTHLGKKLDESIYISLSDHIYTSIKRFQEGITLKNALLWDIKRFYKDEYAIGNKALDIIESKMQVRLSDDEAGFIALHFVNAQMAENLSAIYDITLIMQEISSIVKYVYQIDFDEDSVYYYRFITHLKFFAQRLSSGSTYNDSSDEDLLELIKLRYKNAYACVEKISEFILKKYNHTVTKEEKLYLTIHIERIVSKNNI